jgi:hypothetical protein
MLEETNVDELSDAAIIRGMWAAAEAAAGDDDEAEDGDRLLEQLDPAEVSFSVCDVRMFRPRNIKFQLLWRQPANSCRSHECCLSFTASCWDYQAAARISTRRV